MKKTYHVYNDREDLGFLRLTPAEDVEYRRNGYYVTEV